MAVAAATTRPYVGKKAYGFCDDNIDNAQALLKQYEQIHGEQVPTVSRRIKLNKRPTLTSDHVSKRYDKRLFYTKSSKEQYKDTYIFDNTKLETQKTKDLVFLTQCQIDCIDFILNIEVHRVRDKTRYDIDIHHMAM